MRIEQSFKVPVGIDEAWAVLLNVERIAPCLPGAQLDTVDGDEFTGTVRVKLGPLGLTYLGKGQIVERDKEEHRAVIEARGRDARGNGTAKATITATLVERADETEVLMQTDLDITGKPAQFGRGVIVDVGNRLVGQFADRLANELAAQSEPDVGTAAQAEPESLNLAASIAPALAKRLAPAIVVALVVVIILIRARRRT